MAIPHNQCDKTATKSSGQFLRNSKEIRVVVDKIGDCKVRIRYEEEAASETPQREDAPLVRVLEPIFVNPGSYEAVASVFRKIRVQAGIVAGERKCVAVECDGAPFV